LQKKANFVEIEDVKIVYLLRFIWFEENGIMVDLEIRRKI